MLDVIRERSKGWPAKIILGLIVLVFSLFGIDTYLQQASSNVAVAEVNGDAITVQEYSNALQNLRSQLQAEGQKVDQELLDSPEIKQSVLDRLINNRLLSKAVADNKFAISDEQLSNYIISLPEFTQDGKFSQERYDNILAQNRMTPSQFENGMRADLLVQQVREGIANLAYLPPPVSDNTLGIAQQQREVSIVEIKTADFLPQVNVTEQEVSAYYEQHKDKFRVPEQVKLEFVMLSANSMIAATQVTDEEAQNFYNENIANFQGNEQRRASHILFSFGVSPTDAAKQQARRKAEEVLAQLKQDPDQFEALAKQHSQDPGSAENGGDLGMFGRGMMVKPFEDAVFSMTPGAISDLVESEFGYHIIKLTQIDGQSESFDSVKPKIRAELMYQKALTKFSEQAEQFNNIVYEQSGSLQPAAKTFGLEIRTTDWLSREQGANYFKNDKLVNMVFSDEVLKDKRNTEAVEISPNTLVAARVADYKPEAPRTFDEVKGGIQDFLKLQKANKLAVEKGQAALADLRAGKELDGLEWIPPVVVDRKNAQGLTDLTMNHAFSMDASKLPAYSGLADSNKGYLLVRVTDVKNAVPEDKDELQAARLELRAALAAEYVASYIKSLRQKGDIKIRQQLLADNLQSQ